jgi:hypothetical protein
MHYFTIGSQSREGLQRHRRHRQRRRHRHPGYVFLPCRSRQCLHRRPQRSIRLWLATLRAQADRRRPGRCEEASLGQLADCLGLVAGDIALECFEALPLLVDGLYQFDVALPESMSSISSAAFAAASSSSQAAKASRMRGSRWRPLNDLIGGRGRRGAFVDPPVLPGLEVTT